MALNGSRTELMASALSINVFTLDESRRCR